MAELRTQIHDYARNQELDIPIVEWIDSKLQKRELAEVVKENYKMALEKEKASKNFGKN